MSIATQIVPEPPQPTEFKLHLDQVITGLGYLDYADTARLTCTLCDAILCSQGRHDSAPMPDPTMDEAQLRRWVSVRVTRHQMQKHPEKLWIYTSGGWTQAGWLLKALQECEGK